MAKSVALGLAMIFVALLMAPAVCSEREERILNDHETKTLTVYYQEIIGGPRPNLIPVAGAPGQPRNLNTFGSFFVGNLIARQGISLSSLQIGTGQGIKVITSGNGNQYISVLLVLNNGSTMEFQGVLGEEFSVVGGTGEYRGVKGYASLVPVQEDPATNSVIAKSVIVYKHYDD